MILFCMGLDCSGEGFRVLRLRLCREALFVENLCIRFFVIGLEVVGYIFFREDVRRERKL